MLTIVDVDDAFFSGDTDAQRKAVVCIPSVDVKPIALSRPQSVIRHLHKTGDCPCTAKAQQPELPAVCMP